MSEVAAGIDPVSPPVATVMAMVAKQLLGPTVAETPQRAKVSGEVQVLQPSLGPTVVEFELTFREMRATVQADGAMHRLVKTRATTDGGLVRRQVLRIPPSETY